MVRREVELEVSGRATSAELYPAPGEIAVVLGHGAGNDRRAPLLVGFAARLQAAGHAVALFNFPYMESGRRAPDRMPVLEETVRRAAAMAAGELGAKRLVLGGKSMGGRVAARVAGGDGVPGAEGLLFLGFPLHAAGRPADWEKRAATLRAASLPMLFLQGSRDRLCDPELLGRAVAGLEAHVHVLDGADHSLDLPRRFGRTPDDVLDEIVRVADGWLRGTLAGGSGVS